MRHPRLAVLGVIANLCAWAAKELQLIPTWVPIAVLVLSVPAAVYIAWPWIRSTVPTVRRARLRSPIFLKSDLTPARSIPLDTSDWTFTETGDGRVAVTRGSTIRLLELDGYRYYVEALRDNEREAIHRQWGRLRKPHWTLEELFEIIPVYTDPEGIAWRKSEIAHLPDPAKMRLKTERPDVWGFALGDPDFRNKYPGKLPYD